MRPWEQSWRESSHKRVSKSFPMATWHIWENTPAPSPPVSSSSVSHRIPCSRKARQAFTFKQHDLEHNILYISSENKVIVQKCVPSGDVILFPTKTCNLTEGKQTLHSTVLVTSQMRNLYCLRLCIVTYCVTEDKFLSQYSLIVRLTLRRQREWCDVILGINPKWHHFANLRRHFRGKSLSYPKLSRPWGLWVYSHTAVWPCWSWKTAVKWLVKHPAQQPDK